MSKKILALLMIFTLSFTFMSCSNRDEAEEEFPYTIGITNFADNSALSQCRKGMNETLEEMGFIRNENMKVITKNADGDMKAADRNNASLVAQDVDLICAFSTSTAQSAVKATEEKNIPVVFGAVSDPKSAGLDKGNVTGTAAAINVEDQLELIRTMLPTAKTLGIIYCETEDNSLYAIEEFGKHAAAYGFELKVYSIKTANDLYLASDNLLLEVDCMTVIPDNTVMSALGILLKKAEASNIPVFGSDISQIKKGCVAGLSLDYYEVGVETAKIVAKILEGKGKASDLDYITIDDTQAYYNPEVLETLKLTLPLALEETVQDINKVDEEAEEEE